MKEFLEQYKLDAVLVHTPANMRNISGFTGEGLVYVSKEDAWILTDSRYTIAAAKESNYGKIFWNRWISWRSKC